MIPLPFYLLIENIGVKNLSITLINKTPDKQDVVTSISGLNFHAGLSWLAFSSRIWAHVDNSNIKYIAPNGTVSAAANVDAWVQLKNFFDLSVSTKLNKGRWEQRDLSLKDLTAAFKLDLEMRPFQSLVNIKTVDLEFLKGFIYHSQGQIRFPKDDLSSLGLAIKQQFTLDLFETFHNIKGVLPGADLHGFIAMPELAINGELDLNQINTKKAILPNVSGAFSFTDVRGTLADHGISVLPINGRLGWGVSQASLSQGSEFDLAMNIIADGINIAHKTTGSTHQLNISKTQLASLGRLNFPEFAIPHFNFSIQSDHVVASTEKQVLMDVPLNVNINAQVGNEAKEIDLVTKIDLPTLLNLNADLKCKENCKKAQVSAQFLAGSFEKLYAFVRPIAQKVLDLKFVPEMLEGGLDLRLAAQGNFDLAALKINQDILLADETKIDVDLRLQDFAIGLPLLGFSLEQFNQSIHFDSSQIKQKLKIAQGFSKLSYHDPKQEKPIVVEGFQFRTVLENNSKQPITSLMELKSKSDSSLESTIRIAYLDPSQYFPKPFNNIHVGLKASRVGVKFAKINELLINVPDFGAETTLAAQSYFDKALKPFDYKLDLKSGINHVDGKTLPSGVKTKGRANFDVHIASQDSQNLQVEGLASFDRFYINVPKDTDYQSSLANIENVNGTFPFRQSIDLPKADAQLSNTSAPKNAKTGLNEAIRKFFDNGSEKLYDQANTSTEVDYLNTRGLQPKKKAITIEKISLANLALENLEFDLELRQNWFNVNQFLIGFLGGKIQGDMHLAFSPLPELVKTSVHLSRLDTRKLIDGFPKLKKKAGSFSLFSDPFIDATLHLSSNLKKNELDGLVDVTTIGKEQLRMILFYADPSQKDASISQIRTALNFGEVKQVSIPIKNGFVGMDLDLRVLGAPVPTPQLRGFPISQLIANIKDQNANANTIDSIESEAADDEDDLTEAALNDETKEEEVVDEAI